MAGKEDNELILQKEEIVPNIDPNSHAVSTELWESLSKEVKKVSEEINSGVELKPKDVQRAQSLHKQVRDYVSGFNRSMRSAQQEYKEAVEKRLQDLGYGTIETYVANQRKKQTDIQNKRSSDKLDMLTKIVDEEVEATVVVKETVLSDKMLPAFYDRFPIIKSGSQDKMISDWEPYKQVIKTNLQLVDTFLQDEEYLAARRLPIQSRTMQQLLQYIRSGDIEHLSNMESTFKSDRTILEDMVLRENIQTKQDAINIIESLLPGDKDKVDETIINISKVVNIALNLKQ